MACDLTQKDGALVLFLHQAAEGNELVSPVFYRLFAHFNRKTIDILIILFPRAAMVLGTKSRAITVVLVQQAKQTGIGKAAGLQQHRHVFPQHPLAPVTGYGVLYFNGYVIDDHRIAY